MQTFGEEAHFGVKGDMFGNCIDLKRTAIDFVVKK